MIELTELSEDERPLADIIPLTIDYDSDQYTESPGTLAEAVLFLLDSEAEQPLPAPDIGSIALLQDRKVMATDGEGPDLSKMDTMGVYLSRMGQIPLLKSEETADLAKRYQAGLEAGRQLNTYTTDSTYKKNLLELQETGSQAKKLLIISNLRLVVSFIAKNPHYRDKGLEMADLVQIGNMGLARAVEKYDYTKGFEFSTYATWWIRQKLQKGVSELGGTIRIPISAYHQHRSIELAAQRLEECTGRTPSFEEIARHSGESLENVRVFYDIGKTVSLQQPAGNEGSVRLEDFIPDNEKDVAEEVAGVMLDNIVHEVLAELPDRQQDIIRRRFGIHGSDIQTSESIGKDYGITRQAISRSEKEALKKLKNNPRLQEIFKELFKPNPDS